MTKFSANDLESVHLLGKLVDNFEHCENPESKSKYGTAIADAAEKIGQTDLAFHFYCEAAKAKLEADKFDYAKEAVRDRKLYSYSITGPKIRQQQTDCELCKISNPDYGNAPVGHLLDGTDPASHSQVYGTVNSEPS